MPEDVCDSGCVGRQLLACAALESVELKAARLINLGSGLVSHGSVSELMRDCGLDADSLFDAAEALIRGAK